MGDRHSDGKMMIICMIVYVHCCCIHIIDMSMKLPLVVVVVVIMIDATTTTATVEWHGMIPCHTSTDGYRCSRGGGV